MQRITASAFKAKCWQLMDDVAATGEPLIITKHGQPICQLVPYRLQPKTLYGALHGSMIITGDLLAPLDEGTRRGPGAARAPFADNLLC